MTGRRCRDDLVGRGRELTRLDALLEELATGEGRLVFATGEAGMGKSSLAQEVRTAARSMGARVFWGSCWESVDTPPYWPWIQVVRGLCETAEPQEAGRFHATLQDHLHLLGPHISVDRGRIERAGEDRFLLFDIVWSAIATLAAQQSVVVILDDLHAADESSLLLLQFATKQLKTGPILMFGTYEEAEIRRRPGHIRLMSEMVREAEHLPLRGLDEDEIADLYIRLTGAEPAAGIATDIARLSEGNPYFAREAIRTLTSTGDLKRPDFSAGFRVPTGVRDLIRERLAGLPEDSAEVLSVASVIGRVIQVDLLREVVELDLDTVLELLEAPVRLELLEEAGTLGRYSFAHILIRETLYEDLTAAKRMRLHRRTAETLEELHKDDVSSVLPELAHHWFKAGHAGDLIRTVERTMQAAQKATDAQAHEEALRLYRRALKASESVAVPQEVVSDLEQRLEVARQDVATVATTQPREPQSGGPHNSFVKEGEYWTVTYEGRSSRVKDTKGIRYVAHLLANPGRELHVLDLAGELGTTRPAANQRAEASLDSDAFGDLGSVLDPQAKRELKHRLEELREEAEQADEFNDLERSSRAREEMDSIVQYLAGAVGLRGRDRKAGSAAERARVNVTKTVKDAVRRLADADRKLGDHLTTTIRTGTFCSYTPDSRVPISWRVENTSRQRIG